MNTDELNAAAQKLIEEANTESAAALASYEEDCLRMRFRLLERGTYRSSILSDALHELRADYDAQVLRIQKELDESLEALYAETQEPEEPGGEEPGGEEPGGEEPGGEEPGGEEPGGEEPGGEEPGGEEPGGEEPGGEEPGGEEPGGEEPGGEEPGGEEPGGEEPGGEEPGGEEPGGEEPGGEEPGGEEPGGEDPGGEEPGGEEPGGEEPGGEEPGGEEPGGEEPGGDEPDAPYEVDESLPMRDRYIAVKNYYLSIPDAAEALELLRDDDVAKEYLGTYYNYLEQLLIMMQ